MLHDEKRLREVEAQVSSKGGSTIYRLRVWKECGSFDTASATDRIAIAEKCMFSGGFCYQQSVHLQLVKLLIAKLSDPDPTIRAEAAIALRPFESEASEAIPLLLERLRSLETTLEDRVLATNLLPHLGVPRGVPALLSVLRESANEPEANEIRYRTARAIQQLTEARQALIPVVEICLEDHFWKCRREGLRLARKLITDLPYLGKFLLPIISPLKNDLIPEVRSLASKIVDAFDRKE